MRGSGRSVVWVSLAMAWVLFAAHGALAQDAPAPPTLPPGVSVFQGGEPGKVSVVINGVDVTDATSLGAALDLDPGAPAQVSISMTPPENTTWEVRAIKVGLLVSGPGSQPPEALTRVMGASSTLTPGYTVVVNRTLDLGSLKNLGAGVFLMQVEVQDDSGSDLYAQTFYLHVTGNPLFTVAGAAVTALSVATGYGLWRLFADARELYQTWRRHRRERQAQADAAEKDLLSKAKAALKERERLERRQAIRWTATGLGLGAVGLSWAQFLGYVAFDYTSTLITALETAALFLGVALLLIALRRRIVKREREAVRTLIPTGPEPQPVAATDADVAPEPPQAR